MNSEILENPSKRRKRKNGISSLELQTRLIALDSRMIVLLIVENARQNVPRLRLRTIQGNRVSDHFLSEMIVLEFAQNERNLLETRYVIWIYAQRVLIAQFRLRIVFFVLEDSTSLFSGHYYSILLLES